MFASAFEVEVELDLDRILGASLKVLLGARWEAHPAGTITRRHPVSTQVEISNE